MRGSSLVMLDSGSQMLNKGTLTLRDINLVDLRGSSSFINEGSMNLERTTALNPPNNADGVGLFGVLNRGSSSSVNNGTITAHVLNQGAVQHMPNMWVSYVLNNDSHAVNLMTGVDGGNLLIMVRWLYMVVAKRCTHLMQMQKQITTEPLLQMRSGKMPMTQPLSLPGYSPWQLSILPLAWG